MLFQHWAGRFTTGPTASHIDNYLLCLKIITSHREITGSAVTGEFAAWCSADTKAKKMSLRSLHLHGHQTADETQSLTPQILIDAWVTLSPLTDIHIQNVTFGY